MASFQDWLAAARPRTLPLALSSIAMGSFLAAHQASFQAEVFWLCVLTTTALQVLSNFANDYGDSISGVDSEKRQGPSRKVQSGAIPLSSMRRAIIISAILAFFSGISLLYLALDSWTELGSFLLLGILAIIAAITYTVGKRPYGYAGLGDLSVFIFFGLLGVLGTYYLHSKDLNPLVLLPASSCGLLAVGVLNLNNIRDIESDREAGKKSIPVRIGRAKAVVYHIALLVFALGFALVYVLLNLESYWQFLFLLSLPLFALNIQAVLKKESAEALDPYLRQLALSTLFFVLSFGWGNF